MDQQSSFLACMFPLRCHTIEAVDPCSTRCSLVLRPSLQESISIFFAAPRLRIISRVAEWNEAFFAGKRAEVKFAARGQSFSSTSCANCATSVQGIASDDGECAPAFLLSSLEGTVIGQGMREGRASDGELRVDIHSVCVQVRTRIDLAKRPSRSQYANDSLSLRRECRRRSSPRHRL